MASGMEIVKAMEKLFKPGQGPVGRVVEALSDMMMIASMLPVNKKDDAAFLQFLDFFMMKVGAIQPGGVLVAPAGWSTGSGGHVMLLILTRSLTQLDKYSFAIVNTGEGLEYHAAHADPVTAEIKRNLAFVLHDVPAIRVTDTIFWFMIYRMMVYPDEANGPQIFYERLLPFLNSKPLMANVDETTPWRQPPHGNDTTHCQCIFETVHCAVRMVDGGTDNHGADRVIVLLKWTMVHMMESDLALVTELDSNEEVKVQLAVQQLSHRASELGVQERCSLTSDELLKIADCQKRVTARVFELRAQMDDSVPPPIRIETASTVAGAAAYPLFGRFRRDTSVEGLIGDYKPPGIILPVELTTVPPVAKNFSEVANALRDTVHLCNLLGNQAHSMKNTYLHRVALIMNLVTKVIPMPLAPNHPQRETHCFWTAQPMKYETQAELLRSLSLVSQHFATAAMSLHVTQSFDANRMLIAACLGCLADCIVRIKACDCPSLFSMHYAGATEGPVKPYGFRAQYFAIESETALFYDPECQLVRTQILDYFAYWNANIEPDHVVFKYESTMEFGAGERGLLDQICLATAFPRHLIPQYFTGEEPWFLDNYPELGFFRDIVFMFKAMMAPSSDSLPELAPWLPIQARLFWQCQEGKKGATMLEVRGFNKKLECAAFEADSHAESKGLGHFLGLVKKPRVVPSGGNASHLTGERAENEDDILHIRHLPDFDGQLRTKDSELLLSYLTAPYIRIPLVMEFFTDQIRINSLRNEELQHVMDAVLFEPGAWQEALNKDRPTTVPAPNRDHLATPCGLLFNELEKSPHNIVRCMDKMLEIALELDPGRYNPVSCPAILYIVRLAIRIEGYMLYAISHHDWDMKNADAADGAPVAELTGAMGETHVRGLSANSATIDFLKSYQKKLRARLEGEVFSMLEHWIVRAQRDKSVHSMCILRAHLAYIYKHTPTEDLDFKSVSTLLSSQVYLMSNFMFDADDHLSRRSRKKKGTFNRKAEETTNASLGITQTEMFQLFQSKRWQLYEWLVTNGDECNEVMEAIVRVVTYTGTRAKPKAGSVMKARVWRSMQQHGYRGRFVPDTEAKTDEQLFGITDGQCYEEWLRHCSTSVIETEINLQTGEFTLKKKQTKQLSVDISDHEDFIDVFGQVAKENPVQCADVMLTTKRLHTRLVGRRHDVQFWEPDDRMPVHSNNREYPKKVKDDEEWIKEMLEDSAYGQGIRLQYLDGYDIYLPGDSLGVTGNQKGKNMVIMCAYEKPLDKKDKKHKQRTGTLKEIVCIKEPPLVHIYNVIEQGRRHYRSLVFSSDADFCLRSMEPTPVIRYDVPNYISGDSYEAFEQQESVVVTRHLTSEIGVQTFIPNRCLHGLVPSSLCDDYAFWQNEDDSLYGYMRNPSDSTKRPSMLHIQLFPEGKGDKSGFGNNEASALIRRVPIENPEANHADIKIAEDQPVMTLLNLLYALPGTPVRTLANIFMRLDNLSNCLIWTKSTVASPDDTCTLDAVEFPRLQMSFTAQQTSDGMKLYSDDHQGLFISNHRCPPTISLLAGLPQSLLLENDNKEMCIVMPSICKPTRPACPGGFSTKVLLNRNDADWLHNLGDVRHYIYPIHLTREFVFASTLAQSMYMMLMRCLNRQYERAFHMLDSCINDMPLSGEEQQIFDQLEFLGTDWHPNAAAVRLKLYFATMGCQDVMPYPYDLRDEMAAYVGRRYLVSASCRLTLEEEWELFHIILTKEPYRDTGLEGYLHLKNRHALLRAGRAGGGLMPVIYDENIVTDLVQYDRFVDRTIMDVSKSKMGMKTLKSVVGGISYTRPDDMEGLAAIAKLNKWIDHGVRLRGGKDPLGFVFLYELMTATLSVKIRATDSPHGLAMMLMRLMPAKETQVPDTLMSALRVMANNPLVCTSMPKYEAQTGIKALGNKANQWMNLLVGIKEALDASNDVFWPPSKHSEYAAAPHMAALSLSKYIVADRSTLSPRIKDYALRQRKLCEVPGIAESGTNVGVSSEELLEFGGVMMDKPLGLSNFVELQGRSARGLQDIPEELCFDVSEHSAAKAHVATAMVNSLTEDMKWYANQQNGLQEPKLIEFFDSDISGYVQNPSGSGAKKAIAVVEDLIKTIETQQAADYDRVLDGITHVLGVINTPPSNDGCDEVELRKRYAFMLGAESGRESKFWFELLVGMLLSTTGEADIAKLNPYLAEGGVKRIMDLTVGVMLAANRLGNLMRCGIMAKKVLGMLTKLQGMSTDEAVATAFAQNLSLESTTLAMFLRTERHFVNDKLEYDPRFLAFEFTYNMTLRQQQVRLITRFLDALMVGDSLCHQMIMGAGKTTVVGPMLALLLADGKSLVTQVVPNQLLDMSRNVMRESFTAVIQKPVFTFVFERSTVISETLYTKLSKAKDSRAVVCSTPTAIKSFVLKFIEILHTLENARTIAADAAATIQKQKKKRGRVKNMAMTAKNLGGLFSARTYQSSDIEGMRAETKFAVRIVELFNLGVLLLDEVDLILHPLKSELNWPLGAPH